MTKVKHLVILGVFAAFAALAIGAAQAADPNRLPDIGDAERIVVPGAGLEFCT